MSGGTSIHICSLTVHCVLLIVMITCLTHYGKEQKERSRTKLHSIDSLHMCSNLRIFRVLWHVFDSHNNSVQHTGETYYFLITDEKGKGALLIDTSQ